MQDEKSSSLGLADLRICRIAQLLAHSNADFGCFRNAAPSFDYVALRRNKDQERFFRCISRCSRCGYKGGGIEI